MSKELDELIIDETFQRFLSGTASSSEFIKWDEWLLRSSHNQDIYNEALKLWSAGKFQPDKSPDINQEWQRLQNRIIAEKVNNKTITSNAEVKFRGRKPKSSVSWFVGYAISTVILAVLVFLFVRYQESRETLDSSAHQIVTTEYGQRATLNLPDGTKIILNANSTLKYPASWHKQTTRKVEIQGEAYFDVKKNPAAPDAEFQVITNDGLIKVVGTRFVVYERGTGSRVVLEEGGVEISILNNKTEAPEIDSKVLLKPGQLLQFHKGSKNLTPREVNIKPYITWWRQQFILDKTPFKDIVQRIEETYGVEVKVSNEGLLERTLTGSIENQNLYIVVEALANALSVPASRKGGTINFGKYEIE